MPFLRLFCLWEAWRRHSSCWRGSEPVISSDATFLNISASRVGRISWHLPGWWVCSIFVKACWRRTRGQKRDRRSDRECADCCFFKIPQICDTTGYVPAGCLKSLPLAVILQDLVIQKYSHKSDNGTHLMELRHCSDPWLCRRSYYVWPGPPVATCTPLSICVWGEKKSERRIWLKWTSIYLLLYLQLRHKIQKGVGPLFEILPERSVNLRIFFGFVFCFCLVVALTFA